MDIGIHCKLNMTSMKKYDEISYLYTICDCYINLDGLIFNLFFLELYVSLLQQFQVSHILPVVQISLSVHWYKPRGIMSRNGFTISIMFDTLSRQ